MSDEDVRELLRDRGCSQEVVEAGIHGLVADWERVVTEIGHGYSLGLDDYLGDLDTRQLLEETLPLVPGDDRLGITGRIRAADERLRPHVNATVECLWGEAVAEAEGWTRERNWWYFSVPRHPGEMLRDDLTGY